MLRLIVASLAVLVVVQSARAEQDLPTRENTDYIVGSLNQYVCVNGEAMRMIYVAYRDNVGQPPCAVIYKKLPPENPSLGTPWQAETDASFCEAKAEELVEKLRGFGWECSLLLDDPSSD